MKFLMVGLGGIGQRHVRNLRSLCGADAEIMAYRVRRDSPTLTDQLKVEAGSDLEQKYDLRVFTDLDDALGRQPDAVFVCNPSSLHVAVAFAAARAGAPLFVEKPLSHDWDGVLDLVDEVESRGLVGMVGYQLRFHPCLRRLHDLLAEKAVGPVVAVTTAICWVAVGTAIRLVVAVGMVVRI